MNDPLMITEFFKMNMGNYERYLKQWINCICYRNKHSCYVFIYAFNFSHALLFIGCLFIYLFIYSFTYLFIYLFINQHQLDEF